MDGLLHPAWIIVILAVVFALLGALANMIGADSRDGHDDARVRRDVPGDI